MNNVRNENFTLSQGAEEYP